MFPYTSYTPSLGFYNSGAAATIRSHIEAMRYGHITAAITSWWGANQKGEQLRVPTLLTTAADVDPTVRIALYYEKEGTGDPSVPELKQDLEYILKITEARRITSISAAVPCCSYTTPTIRIARC